MRLYAEELICSKGVLGFQTFELSFCVFNKLYSLAEILSQWAFVVTFPWIQPSSSEVQSAVSFERE